MLKKKKFNHIISIILMISYFTVFVFGDYGRIYNSLKVYADDTSISEDIFYGDINLDGEINTVDLIILAKIVSGRISINSLSEQSKKNARVYDNVVINSECLLCMLKYLVGSLKEFPAANVSDLDKLKKIANESYNKEIPNALIGFDFGDTSLYFDSTELFNKNITIYSKVSNYTEKAYSDLIDDLKIKPIGDPKSIFNYPSEIGIYPKFYKTSVTPVLKIGDTEYIGNDIPLDNTKHTMTIAIGQEDREPYFYDIQYTAGEMFSIVLDFGTMSANELALAYTDYINSTEDINISQKLSDVTDLTSLDERNIYSTEYLGKMLRFIGCYYFAQLDSVSAELANQVKIIEKPSIKVARFGYKTQITNGYIQKNGYYYCDVFGDDVNLISSDGNKDNLKLFAAERNSIGSSLEHVVIEEITGIDAISTVKIIEEAKEQNIEILTLYKDSEKSVNDLPIDSYLKNALNQYIEDGKVITIPASEISIGGWTGIGYIVISNDGTSRNEIYGQLIGTIINGGYGTAYVSFLYINYLTLEGLFIAAAIIGICTLSPWLAPLAVAGIALSVFGIIEQSFNAYGYIVDGNLKCAEALRLSLAITSGITIAGACIGKIVKECAGAAAKSKAAAKIGNAAVDKALNSCSSGVKAGAAIAINKYGAKVAAIIAEYGDEAVRIIEKYGDNAIRCIAEYGDDAIRYISEFGDNMVAMYKSIDNIAVKYSDDVMKYTSFEYRTGQYKPLITTTEAEYRILENYADDMYNLFRTTNDDIAVISKNTGWSIDDITQIKKHLFKNELLLDDGYKLLDPDYEIAVAWQRLIDNNYYKPDVLLLQHELYESTYYNYFHSIIGITQREAHNITLPIYDWNSELLRLMQIGE